MKLSLFSFLPGDYEAMQAFLEQKLEEGLRLKWVKWGIAAFEPLDPEREQDYFLYAVDPYLNESFISSLGGKMPRVRSNLYMQNKWTFIGKSHKNHIFFTTSDSGEYVPVDADAKQKVAKFGMYKNAIIVGLLLFGLYSLLHSKLWMYNFVLSSVFQYICIIAAFLGLTSLVITFLNACILANYGGNSVEAAKKRGSILLVRTFGLVAIILFCFILIMTKNPAVAPFALIPLGILLVAGLVIFLIYKKSEENLQKRITPVILVAAALMLVTIFFGISGMNRTTSKQTAAKNEADLALADSLPVLHYADVYGGAFDRNMCESKTSLFGDSYRYQEFTGNGEQLVFNNCNTMTGKKGMQRVFDYLYMAGEQDYGGTFGEPLEVNGMKVYEMTGETDGVDAYLLCDESSYRVSLICVRGNADKASVRSAVKELAGK